MFDEAVVRFQVGATMATESSRGAPSIAMSHADYNRSGAVDRIVGGGTAALAASRPGSREPK